MPSPTLLSLALLIVLALALRPKQKGILPSSAGPFLANASEEILAYYDFDRDGKIDILTKSISNTEQRLNVYIWNAARKEYYPSGSLPIDYPALKTAMVSSFKVFDNFHLLLYFWTEQKNYAVLRPFKCADYQCLFEAAVEPTELQGLDAVSPTLMGVSGEIGILYSQGGAAKLLTFSEEDKSVRVRLLSDLVEGGQPIVSFKHSYFGDYNGDCLPDLVLLTKTAEGKSKLQFIGGTTTNTLTFAYEAVFEDHIHHFTIKDINFDGKNDLILLLHSAEIQIHYHRYGDDQTLCNGTPLTESPYHFAISDQLTLIQRFSLPQPLHPSALLLFGDYDNDGYDDFTVTLAPYSDSNLNPVPHAHLYRNIPCIGAECGSYNLPFLQQTSTLNVRSFKKVQLTGVNPISTRLSFVDILEDGTLDLMLNMQVVDEAGKHWLMIQPIYNNIDYDAFFLTITILAPRSTDLLTNTEYIGGCASFYVTLLSGELAPKSANQLTQCGPSLQLPYIRQGLGRTNNYLEQLTLTVPRTTFSQFVWSPIIPNSEILILPPASGSPQWTLKVMIEPTEKMGFVLLLVIISLACVGVAILHLTRKEKEEDQQIQERFYILLR